MVEESPTLELTNKIVACDIGRRATIMGMINSLDLTDFTQSYYSNWISSYKNFIDTFSFMAVSLDPDEDL